jgi:hypothetical protein
MRLKATVFGLFLLLCWYALGRPVVEIDGLNHYAVGKSIVLDGDICLDNQRLFPFWNVDPYTLHYFLKNTGYLTPDQPLGVSLVTLPWGAWALGWTTLVQAGGGSLPWSGDSFTFAASYAACALGALAAGLVLLGPLLRRVGGALPTLWALAATVFCTPLVFYVLRAPSYAHVWNFLATIVFLQAWHGWTFVEESTEEGASPTVRSLVLGMLLGVVQLLRYEAGLAVAAVLVASYALYWLERGRGRPTRLVRYRLVPLALGWAVVFSVQVSFWKIVYGTMTGPLGERLAPVEDFLGSSFLFRSLLSHECGLLTWHPWIFVAFVGLLAGVFRAPRLFLPLLAGVLAHVAFYAGHPWLGYSFGHRHVCTVLPMLAMGFVVLLGQRWFGIVARVLTVVLATWNLVLMQVAPRAGWMTDHERLSFPSWREFRRHFVLGLDEHLATGWLAQTLGWREWTWSLEGVAFVLPLAVAAASVGLALLGMRHWRGSAVVLVAACLLANGFLWWAHSRTEVWHELHLKTGQAGLLGGRTVWPAETLPRRVPTGEPCRGRYEHLELRGGTWHRFDLRSVPAVDRVAGAAALLGAFAPGETAAIVTLLDSRYQEVARWELRACEDLGFLEPRDGACDGLSPSLVRDATQEHILPAAPVRRMRDPRQVFSWSRDLPRFLTVAAIEIAVQGPPEGAVVWYSCTVHRSRHIALPEPKPRLRSLD